jgi:hypothetical protein
VFDDSTANDATTSWAGSELIGTLWDSDQHDGQTKSRGRSTRNFKEHDGQSTSWQVRIGTVDVRTMMNMKSRTTNTIGELSDSDDLMAIDTAGITKNTTTAKNQLGDDTDTHERSSTRKLDTPLRAENFRARDKQQKSKLHVWRGLDNPQQGLVGREHRKELESERWVCHERTEGGGGSRREQRSRHAGENSGRARASPACREEGCAERRQGKDPGSRRGWALYGGAPRAYIKGVRAVLKIQRASDVEDEC